MNTDQVHLLIDLAQTHSFNQTAERLYTTQQTVSYKIKQLEQELETMIFSRSSSGVEFTTEGEYVLQCAYEMERAYLFMKEKIKHKDVEVLEKMDVVKLHVSSALLSSVMTDIIKTFNAEFPGIKLVIKEENAENTMEALVNHQCDLAFMSIYKEHLDPIYIGCQDRSIEVNVIAEDFATAVISKRSLLAVKNRLSLHDLSVSPKSLFGVIPEDYFGKNIEPYILYEDNNIDIHKQLILEEDVICFTSKRTYERLFSKELFVAKLFDYPTWPIEHITLKRKDLNNHYVVELEQIIKEKI